MYTLNLNITICLTHSNCIYKNTLRADNNLFLNIILQLLLKIDVGNKLLIIGNNYLINGHKEKYFHHNKHLEKHTNTQSVIIS